MVGFDEVREGVGENTMGPDPIVFVAVAEWG